MCEVKIARLELQGHQQQWIAINLYLLRRWAFDMGRRTQANKLSFLHLSFLGAISVIKEINSLQYNASTV